VGRDGDGSDGQVDGDEEVKRGRSDRVAGLPFMAAAERRRVGDEPRQVNPGGGKTTIDKWAPLPNLFQNKNKTLKIEFSVKKKYLGGEKKSQKICGERMCNLEQLL
jgi:hypothetical protein